MKIKKRTVAKLTGYSLIIMAVSAGFSLGFAFPKIFNQNQLYYSHHNIAENLQLYKLMLLGLIIVLFLDVFVSWTLYEYFKTFNKKTALFSGILRFIYSITFGFAIFYLSKNIDQDNSLIVIENYNLFQIIWSLGLIIFGIHLVIIGMLMKLDKFMPNFLWCLTIIAGLSYIMIHFLKTIFPQLIELFNFLNTIMGIPMALSELCLAIWLIMKGGNDLK